MTREMLDELLVDAPQRVTPDVGGAWRAGTARRRRRYVVTVLAACAVVLLLGVGVLGFDRGRSPDPADGSPGVDGHPVKVARPVLRTSLPARPGPMAGVMEHGDGSWSLLDSAGRSWPIADMSSVDSYPPALSDDGRLLGYLRETDAQRSEYVLVDLTTGERVAFPKLGDSVGELDLTVQPFWVNPQAPGYWSPDDSWLTVNGTRAEQPTSTGPLLLSTTGEVRELDVSGWAVGWDGPDRVVMLDRSGGSVFVVDLEGRELRRSVLTPAGSGQVGQWSGRTSPDGERLAVHSGDGVVRVFDIATGAEIDMLVTDLDGFCSLAWDGDRVVGWADEAVRDGASRDPVVRFSTEWGSVQCAVFTSDALAGAERSPGLVEWRYWQWLWWWPWILGAVLAVCAALGIRRSAHRRRGQVGRPA